MRFNVKTNVKSIVRNLDYWFAHRRLTSSALPWYKHGNDSGWDNASLFQWGMPVQAPDLAVHLIRSFELLLPLLKEIGERSDAGRLKEEAESLFDGLMQELLDEEGFFARSLEGEILPRTSLLLRYPILILSTLDSSIQGKLLQDLEENFVVPAGVSTEDSRSEYYREDGYWLGPVWAPSTYLIYDALCHYAEDSKAPHRAQASELAKRIAEGFLWACETSGMAENYHPITANSQSDPVSHGLHRYT